MKIIVGWAGLAVVVSGMVVTEVKRCDRFEI